MNSLKYSSIIIHDDYGFESMRKAGNLTARILDKLYDIIAPGITTNEINDYCHDLIIKENAIPANLGYKGFPKSVCTSVNHIVCHGIPNEKMLNDGDIIGVDLTCIVNGWHGDSCRTYLVGESFNRKNGSLLKRMKLAKVGYESMIKGIEAVKPGNKLSDIAKAIQTFVEGHGFSVVREYTGHGVGKDYHANPTILHYYEKDYFKSYDEILQPGMFFTIEPMINEGSAKVILSKTDGWTVSTRDKSLSAQFEHSIGVTVDGCEIFTLSPAGKHYPEILKNLTL